MMVTYVVRVSDVLTCRYHLMMHDQMESYYTYSYHLPSGYKIDYDGLHSSSSTSFCTVFHHFEQKKGSCSQVAAGIYGVRHVYNCMPNQ